MIKNKSHITIIKAGLLFAYSFMFIFSAFHNHDTCIHSCLGDNLSKEHNHDHAHNISNKDCTLLKIYNSSLSHSLNFESFSFELSHQFTLDYKCCGKNDKKFSQIHLRGPPIV